jgi:transmembrane 9 superfamily protein 2/4
MRFQRSVLALVVLLVASATAFYVPGVLPASYAPGTKLWIKVNSMTSTTGVMPFKHYSIKTCKPSEERMKKETKVENLGEILWGDRIEPSEYMIEMNHNISCRLLCDPIKMEKADMDLLVKRIEQNYRGNMVLDNLPVGQETKAGPRFPKVILGYPLGLPAKYSSQGKTVINNHLHFTIAINLDLDLPGDAEDEFRIVGFYVTAHSVDHKDVKKCDANDFKPSEHPVLTSEADTITWSYGVSWVAEPDVAWATRWDVYLRGGENDDRIHWMSIINSLLVVVLLSAMVAMIMLRTLHKDFNKYNDPANAEEARDETGWKMVHNDVFRPPAAGNLLAALVGSGAQLGGMMLITLIFACLGFLSPSNRGALLTAIILLYVLLGAFGGYTSARLLKFFKRQSWFNAFITGAMLPGGGMCIYLLINLVQWVKHAASAIPFTTLLLIMALWLLVSLPLSIVGAAIGFRRPVYEVPCGCGAVPRFIPEPKWYLQKWVMVLGAGILPFGACFIELVFILSSFWQGRVYYVFGFVALVFVILTVTCAEVAIVLVYFQLTNDDYHWWWRSWLMTASAGFHLFLYSLYYLVTALSIQQISSTLLYIGYMSLAGTLFGIYTGAIGFWSTWMFVRKIYSSIKLD